MRMLAFIIMLLSLPVSGFAVEAYDSVLFEGNAPITVDGDLSEWSELSLTAPQLLLDDSNSPEPPVDEDDFSATFQCCADLNYVYVAVNVKDDKLVYGEERLGKAFHDDSVFIHFLNGRKEHSRSTIVVALDELGEEKLEYYENPVNQRYPYVWEALGVRAVYRQVTGGYAVEVAIPHRAMGLSDLPNALHTQLNVEVYDDDNSIERESALLLNYQGWWYADWYYADINFTKTEISQDTASPEMQDETGSSLEVEAVIGSPDQTSGQDIIYSIFQDTTHEDWSSAETKLLSAGDYSWVKPMLAWVQYMGKNYDSAVGAFSDVANESPDESVKIWAQYFEANACMENGDFQAAITKYNDLLLTSNFVVYSNSVTDLAKCEQQVNGYESAVAVFEREEHNGYMHPLLLMELGRLHARNRQYEPALDAYERLLANSDDQEYRYYALREMSNIYVFLGDESAASVKAGQILERRFGKKFEIAEALERAGDYDEAIRLFESIIQSDENASEVEKAHLGLARNYYFKGDYTRATQLADDLVRSGDDAKIVLDAKMLRISAERKQKAK